MPPAGERTTRRYGTSSHSKNGEMCVSIQEKKRRRRKKKRKKPNIFFSFQNKKKRRGVEENK
jgi:hypothetical protein